MKLLKSIWFLLFPTKESKSSVTQLKEDPSIEKLSREELLRYKG